MRLVCPSCAAEYQVDDAAIGDRGRMVRCAGCSSEWFQAPVSAAAAAPVQTPPPPASQAPEAAPAAKRSADFGQSMVGEASTYRVAENRPVVEPAEPVVETPPETGPEPEPASENIYFDEDPSGLDAAAAAAVVVEETQLRSRRTTEPEDLAASLRDQEEEVKGGGGAFLAGFATVTLLALILIAVYVKAPDIAAIAPAAEAPLASYAEAVDRGRAALMGLIGG